MVRAHGGDAAPQICVCVCVFFGVLLLLRVLEKGQGKEIVRFAASVVQDRAIVGLVGRCRGYWPRDFYTLQ